uniref:Methyltransferase type 11 domain-containing protein n=1 Tax=viral metagenome TaxID=1070528 RepID=A0A6C0B3E4_9ZZZZ
MDIENEYVLDVYDNIADHFSDTRFCTWDFVDKFINKRTPEERGIEIGCGNGKNLCIREDLNIIGVDTCKKFIDICNEKGLRTFHQNCCKMAFSDNSFDYAMSIAVFHHMASDTRRYKALKEMIRILKPGGRGVISVWALKQNDRNNNMKVRRFTPGDNYVSWRRKVDQKIFKRYYYIFDETAFDAYLNLFSEKIAITKKFKTHGNWVATFIKK